MAIQKSIGKWKFRPAVELQPLKIYLKFGTCDYVRDMATHANFGQIGLAGGYPQIREI